jgi:hypothetical protein
VPNVSFLGGALIVWGGAESGTLCAGLPVRVSIGVVFDAGSIVVTVSQELVGNMVTGGNVLLGVTAVRQRGLVRSVR